MGDKVRIIETGEDRDDLPENLRRQLIDKGKAVPIKTMVEDTQSKTVTFALRDWIDPAGITGNR